MKKSTENIMFIALFCLSCFNIKADGLKQENFDKLEGYEVKFDYEGYPEEREIAYKYLIDCYGNDEPILEKNQIGIDLYDIDNDGKKEILIYIENSGLCGSAGCSFEVLKPYSKDHKLKKVDRIFSMNVYDDIKILNNITLGSHDLLLNIKFDRYTIWRWNGKLYILTKKLSKVSKEEFFKSFFKN